MIYDGDKILILDKLPKEDAKNVIRINSAGIGFSNTGINGTFNSAWLIDGTFDAQNINVINLSADAITSGTLDAQDINVINLSADAITSGTLDADRIGAGSFSMTGGTISIDTDDASYSPIVINYMSRTTKIDGQDVQNTYAGVTADLRYDTIGFYAGNVFIGGMTVNNNDGRVYMTTDYGNFVDVSATGTVKGMKIAVTSPGSTSNAAGILYSTTYGGYTLCTLSGSSKRFKHGIRELTETKKAEFEKLYDVNVKLWTYNDDYIDPADALYRQETFGIIAEDLKEAIPSAVTYDQDGQVQNYI